MKRTIYFDCLRILATIAVVILHVAAQNWYVTNIHSYEWNVMNIYDSLVRWGVPIFVMISGALFLEREVDIKRLYTHNIFKIVLTFIIWTTIYAVGQSLYKGFEWKTFIKWLIGGHYHMWFLFMIVGLYMMVPFLKKIVESESLTRYFLGLGFVAIFIIKYCADVLELLGITLGKLANTWLANFELHMVTGYVLYFVGGYYLSKIELNKKLRVTIYISGVIGFVSTIFLTKWLCDTLDRHVSYFYTNFTLNVFLESVAVFVFIKQLMTKIRLREHIEKCISKISGCCFTAYLVHVLVIEILRFVVGLDTMTFDPLLSVPIISLIVLVISFAFAALVKLFLAQKKAK